MAEPSYINTPSSELDEPKEVDTPSRKAVKVLRDDLCRREIFAMYGVAKTVSKNRGSGLPSSMSQGYQVGRHTMHSGS